MRKNQILLSSDDDIATEIATILSIDEETKRASVQFEDETILPSIEFFYHCMPDDVEKGYQAFTVSDKIIVAERKYIIGFEDLKPRACEVRILGGTDGSQGRILKSLDMGETWSNLGQQFGQLTIRGIVGLEGGVVLAGTRPNGKIIRSTDKGEIWTDLGQQYGLTWIFDIIDLGNGVCLAGGETPGLILKSTDYGQTWVNKGQQFNQTAILELANAGNGVCLAVTYGKDDQDKDIGKILRSVNYGDSWAIVQEIGPSDGWWFDSVGYMANGVCMAGAVWGTYNKQIFRSTDYGLTWYGMDIPSAGKGFWEAPTYVGNGICLFGFHQSYGNYEGHVYRSTDYGVSWADLGQMFGEEWIYELAYIGKGICLAGTGPNGKILRSTDKGLNWTDLGTQTGLAYPSGITALKRLSVGF